MEASLLPLNGLVMYSEAVAVEAKSDGELSVDSFFRAEIRPDG